MKDMLSVKVMDKNWHIFAGDLYCSVENCSSEKSKPKSKKMTFVLTSYSKLMYKCTGTYRYVQVHVIKLSLDSVHLYTR